MKYLDNFLNAITMYRLVLYSLLSFIGFASVLGFAGILPYSGFAILFAALFLKIVCWLTNYLFSKAFNVPANAESSHITALILALVITPPKSIEDFGFLFWAGVLSMVAKYILAIGRKHLFNPVAISLVICMFAISQSASWWVGTVWMLPLVILCGLLITRKLRRWDLVITFLAVSFINTIVWGVSKGGGVLETIEKNMLYSPLFFFAFIMLTEPLTTPPTRRLRIIYAAFIGLLIPPQVHIGSLYSTPEVALVIGNIFSYLVSSKQRLVLQLTSKIKIAANAYDFLFTSSEPIKFSPGQYLEWTVPGRWDSRGNRRYFTIASAPTETLLRVGVKFPEKPSAFKNELLSLQTGDHIIAGQLAGDFTLPKDTSKKLVLIAGGIGITPFRSMIASLIATNEKRNITLFYVIRDESEIAYKDVFEQAQQELGIKTVYVITKTTGHITAEMIEKVVPDFAECLYYLSGSNAMVNAYKKLLKQIGIQSMHIKTDYFPGY